MSRDPAGYECEHTIYGIDLMDDDSKQFIQILHGLSDDYHYIFYGFCGVNSRRYHSMIRQVPLFANSPIILGASRTSEIKTLNKQMKDDEHPAAVFRTIGAWGVHLENQLGIQRSNMSFLKNNPVSSMSLYKHHPEKFTMVLTDDQLVRLEGAEDLKIPTEEEGMSMVTWGPSQTPVPQLDLQKCGADIQHFYKNEYNKSLDNAFYIVVFGKDARDIGLDALKRRPYMWNRIKDKGRVRLKYNKKGFNFVDEIRSWFNCYDLKRIHENYKSDFDVLTFETDQSTEFHKKFYSMPHDSEFYKIYKKFIRYHIQPLFDEPIIFQKIPTFRTQVPDNLSVAEWHKDSDYNHVTEEVNIFLPLTDAFDTNTIWAESRPEKEDFTPMEATPGEFYVWSGCSLVHGNKINKTGQSRVSIDFRVMPISLYKENDRTSTSNKTKMLLGHYFEKLEDTKE